MKPKDYSAYLFDWDGTLAQTLDIWLKIMHELLARHGVRHDDKTVVQATFGRVREGFVELGVPPEHLDEAEAELKALANERILNAPLYPHVKPLLTTLHRDGKQLALITASHRPIVEVMLEAHGVRDYFDLVVTGDDVHAPKPDPQGILYAIETLDLPKDRVVMVGDSDKDLLAAKNAGIASLLFYPPQHDVFYDPADLHACGPAHTVTSWQELTDQLQ